MAFLTFGDRFLHESASANLNVHDVSTGADQAYVMPSTGYLVAGSVVTEITNEGSGTAFVMFQVRINNVPQTSPALVVSPTGGAGHYSVIGRVFSSGYIVLNPGDKIHMRSATSGSGPISYTDSIAVLEILESPPSEA